MKSHHTANSQFPPTDTLFRTAPPNSPFSSIKEFLLPCSLHLLVGHLRLLVLNSNSLLFPNKPMLLVK